MSQNVCYSLFAIQHICKIKTKLMVHIIYSWHAFKLIFQLHILTYSYFKIEWENDKQMYNETHILCELKIWSEFFISINIMTNQSWYKHLKVQLSVQVSVQVSVNYYFQWRNGQILICRVIHTMSWCSMELLIPAVHNSCVTTHRIDVLV